MSEADTSIKSTRDRISRGEASAVDLCQKALEQIDAHKDLNAFLTVTADRALEKAAEVDKLASEGRALPRLAGALVDRKSVV